MYDIAVTYNDADLENILSHMAWFVDMYAQHVNGTQQAAEDRYCG